MKKARVPWTVGLICILGGLASLVFAQAPRTAQSTSLDDLLAEVRGLRAELNQVSAASIRTQLLTARLQLQEQRIFSAGRQLTEVQAQLATVREEILTGQQMVERLEAVGGSSNVPADQQNPLQLEVARAKAVTEQRQARQMELQTQEASLINTLNGEQGRWTEFNGRLDEIERSLSTGGAR